MSTDTELSLLSAILRSRDAALQASDELYDTGLSVDVKPIYDAAMEALESGVRPDADTVETHLDAREQLSPDVEHVLEEAKGRRVTPMNVGLFIDQINERHLESEVKRACDEVYLQVDNGEVEGEEAQDLFEKRAMEIGGNRSGHFRSMDEIITSAKADVEEAMAQDGGVIGVPSGLPRLDEITAGFQGGKLYVIAARPAAGKSALAGTCVYNSAEKGHKNAGFLLEMAAEGFSLRGVAKRARVDSFDLTTGQLSDNEFGSFEAVAEEVKDLPIYLDDTPGITVEQIYRRIRRLKMQIDIDIVWVDYMQLIKESGVGSNRNLEVGHMSRTLKKMAKELDIPVVALCQLNRSVEKRKTPKPNLADLRDSGEIEQDTDVAIFIYRPEMYGITVDENGNSVEGVAKLMVKKHRGGPTGTAEVFFHDEYATFEPLSHM